MRAGKPASGIESERVYAVDGSSSTRCSIGSGGSLRSGVSRVALIAFSSGSASVAGISLGSLDIHAGHRGHTALARCPRQIPRRTHCRGVIPAVGTGSALCTILTGVALGSGRTVSTGRALYALGSLDIHSGGVGLAAVVRPAEVAVRVHSWGKGRAVLTVCAGSTIRTVSARRASVAGVAFGTLYISPADSGHTRFASCPCQISGRVYRWCIIAAIRASGSLCSRLAVCARFTLYALRAAYVRACNRGHTTGACRPCKVTACVNARRVVAAVLAGVALSAL